MTELNHKQIVSLKSTDSVASLQLLLFVDERPSSRKQIEPIHAYLESLKGEYPFELMVIEVADQPHLVEHFRLIATPALIKIYPEPRQTLAGSNLITQLKNWLPRWRRSLEELLNQYKTDSTPISKTTVDEEPSVASSVSYSAELIRLSDEIFQLKQEKEELLEQIKFKDQVLGMLAHDLRSPLTVASIAMETIELDAVSSSVNEANPPRRRLKPEQKEQIIKQARQQFRAMDRMISDILEATKGASAELRVQPHKLQFGEFCQEILLQMQERFQIKSQQIKTDIPQDLPYVYGDKERLRQVMVNLLDNAIKYTDVGGTISVAILHRTTQKIQVSVCDNGLGIPEENRDRIFEDRFRLQRDQAKDGYGIGLALCQRIVRAHYGSIWVDSDSGGSCFHFTLPIYQ